MLLLCMFPHVFFVVFVCFHNYFFFLFEWLVAVGIILCLHFPIKSILHITGEYNLFLPVCAPNNEVRLTVKAHVTMLTIFYCYAY